MPPAVEAPVEAPPALATLRRFLPYLWPSDNPKLRARVVGAMLLVLASKAVTLSMGWLYKGAIDQMTTPQNAAVMLAIGLGIGLTAAVVECVGWLMFAEPRSE